MLFGFRTVIHFQPAGKIEWHVFYCYILCIVGLVVLLCETRYTQSTGAESEWREINCLKKKNWHAYQENLNHPLCVWMPSVFNWLWSTGVNKNKNSGLWECVCMCVCMRMRSWCGRKVEKYHVECACEALQHHLCVHLSATALALPHTGMDIHRLAYSELVLPESCSLSWKWAKAKCNQYFRYVLLWEFLVRVAEALSLLHYELLRDLLQQEKTIHSWKSEKVEVLVGRKTETKKFSRLKVHEPVLFWILLHT